MLNTATGVAVTATSVFQLASVTKLWTATLIMQLVDDGLLNLDRPVRAYLPGFRVADEHASATVTPRHLLSHTAGFDAEVVTETTNGDDAIATFVDEYLPTVGQLFAPGEHHSYNNSGYSLLGRIVEVLRGRPYRQVLGEHLVDPLGLRHVATRADEAVLFHTSVGHHPSGVDGRQTPASGQYALLRMVPDRDVAFVLFCNGGNVGGLFLAVSDHLLTELAGVEASRRLTPPADQRPVDPHRYVGRYRAAAGGTCTVEPRRAGRPVADRRTATLVRRVPQIDAQPIPARPLRRRHVRHR